jgi:hypothetical protein
MEKVDEGADLITKEISQMKREIIELNRQLSTPKTPQDKVV